MKTALLLLPLLAFANSPEPDPRAISLPELEEKSRSLFCHLQGKGCSPEKTKAKCAPLKEKNQLAGFRCVALPQEPATGKKLKALAVNFDKQGEYLHSQRVARPVTGHDTFENKGHKSGRKDKARP